MSESSTEARAEEAELAERNEPVEPLPEMVQEADDE